MQFTIAALALVGAVAAQNNTANAGSAFAPGYTQSCQGYYDECSRLSGRCQSGLDDCSAKCEVIYNGCRTGPNANQATCVASYATCLGKLPAGVNAATGTTTAAMVTAVVQTLTVDCPYATSVTYNGQVYVASSSTKLTITNCPCTVTTPAVAVPTGANNVTSSPTPVPYKGAANKAVAGSGLLAGVAGLAVLL
ncbi:hypothetical protein BDZ85DRAFT_286419 [Elsinoe ampelina]|uniref:Uncharacterized protein n=1 Tax=Elsinoe ampelina TaxID=302913 RepID=A0A6A6FXY2_9PEZI|nr:hypothetical protein BDZ85DRAFT_286419 [Elsinoe ampelina]